MGRRPKQVLAEGSQLLRATDIAICVSETERSRIRERTLKFVNLPQSMCLVSMFVSVGPRVNPLHTFLALHVIDDSTAAVIATPATKVCMNSLLRSPFASDTFGRNVVHLRIAFQGPCQSNVPSGQHLVHLATTSELQSQNDIYPAVGYRCLSSFRS